MKYVATPQLVYPFIVGIDLSKESMDVCMIEMVTQREFTVSLTNTSEGYTKLKRWMKQHGTYDLSVKYLKKLGTVKPLALVRLPSLHSVGST